MSKFILIATLSAALFYLLLLWWGARQVKKCGEIPMALKTSFMNSNKDESWHLEN
jgi:hypothetical protein